MNYPSFVGAHGFERYAPLPLHRLCSLGNGDGLELFFTLGAVAFAVHHYAPVFVPADVGNGASYALNGIEHLAPAADYRRGIGRLYFNLYLVAVGHDFVESGDF